MKARAILADFRKLEEKNGLKATAFGKKRLIIKCYGQMNAHHSDQRIILRLNDIENGYRSFALMNGDAGAGEWDQRGLYIGRTAWGLDADWSFIATVHIATGFKRTMIAESTFVFGDDRVLGYEYHGFWSDTQTEIDSVGVYAYGNPAGDGKTIIDLVWE